MTRVDIRKTKTATTDSVPAHQILSLPFNFIGIHDVLSQVVHWRDSGRTEYISITNPHSVMMCQRDAEMDAATRGAALTLADGVGVIIAARLLGYGRKTRITGPKLMLWLCDRGREHGLKHYFYGGAEGVADELADRFRQRFPGIEIAGTMSPPYRELSAEEDAQIVSEINATNPDIVWVCLGAPKQEKWMAAHHDASRLPTPDSRLLNRITAPAMIGVGAAFDFHTDRIKWAPQWMRRLGIEWLYRLIQEPRRMWRRNLDSPLFLTQALWNAMNAKRKRRTT